MIERRIKELSIALEALSRINALESEFQRVNRLLDGVIFEAEEQQRSDRLAQANITSTTDNDDIPL